MIKGARDRTTPSKRIARLCAATLLVAAVVAYATGLAPLAFDDDIAAVRGRTVTRLANGATSVLANDRDLEGDTLTAILVENPRRGSLSLRPDGTFIYTHDGSSANSDRFRYRASDGTGTSRIADVDIEISDPSVAPQIVGQRALSVPEDGALQVRLQDLVVQDPDSDYPQDFTLTITAGANFTVQGATVRPVSNFNGTLSVPTRVNDGQTDSNVFNLAITVTPVNDRPIVAQPIGPREAVQGRRFELDARAAFDDRDAGDTLTFTATGLPASNSLVLSPTSGLLSGTPQAGDVRALPYSVSITARDSAGASVSTTFPLTIVAAKADVAITAKVDPNPADLPSGAHVDDRHRKSRRGRDRERHFARGLVLVRTRAHVICTAHLHRHRQCHCARGSRMLIRQRGGVREHDRRCADHPTVSWRCHIDRRARRRGQRAC